MDDIIIVGIVLTIVITVPVLVFLASVLESGRSEIMGKCCGNCRHYGLDAGGWFCFNQDSFYCGIDMAKDMKCEKWEAGEDD